MRSRLTKECEWQVDSRNSGLVSLKGFEDSCEVTSVTPGELD